MTQCFYVNHLKVVWHISILGLDFLKHVSLEKVTPPPLPPA